METLLASEKCVKNKLRKHLKQANKKQTDNYLPLIVNSSGEQSKHRRIKISSVDYEYTTPVDCDSGWYE